jgi:hypothetical protein
MTEKIFIDRDDALAVVKFKGIWRFFYDMEIMFLLDYTSYDGDYDPLPGQFRYGTMIVSDANAEMWIKSLSGELFLEQLLDTYWENSEKRVVPTFVIDFDKRLWVGNNWSHDQSPLHEYQPQDWIAREDDVMNYLPAEVRIYFE